MHSAKSSFTPLTAMVSSSKATAMHPLRRRTHAPKPLSTTEDCADVCCVECGSDHSPAELLLCDRCDNGYHLFCLRPILVSVPKGSWFCPSCSHYKTPKSFPLVQTKIIDFFRIRRSFESTQKLSQDSLKKRKRSSSLVMSKKKRKLLPFIPTDDPERRLEQMRSLATALTASRTQFSNELTYQPGMAPRSANCPALEKGGMQVKIRVENLQHLLVLLVRLPFDDLQDSNFLTSISACPPQVLPKEDIETLNLCRSMMDRGECPPLLVVFDPQEGFTVEADRSIKDLTIITEYVGDVDFLKNRENDDGDSMMTLLCAENPLESLVICPDKRGNIARFINGINNYSLDGKKKQNLKCVRYNVNGECGVLLIANRDIKKGERLYYDYNGLEHEYPTEHFV